MQDKPTKPLRLQMSSPEIAEALDQTRWANEFNWDQMSKLSEAFVAHKAYKDTVIYKEGANARAMGIIIEGRLNVVKEIEGKQRCLASLRAPQTFGEMSLIDGEPRSARVVAAEDSVILTLTKDALDNLTKDNATLAYKLVFKVAAMISQRLRKTTGELVESLSHK